MQLLPSGLDEELLRSTWLRLPVKNRTHKDALMQGYRRHFPHWRLQLRCGCMQLAPCTWLHAMACNCMHAMHE